MWNQKAACTMEAILALAERERLWSAQCDAQGLQHTTISPSVLARLANHLTSSKLKVQLLSLLGHHAQACTQIQHTQVREGTHQFLQEQSLSESIQAFFEVLGQPLIHHQTAR